MASRDGSRKRVKLSREGNAVAVLPLPTPSSSGSTPAKETASSANTSAKTPCVHEKALFALHTDIDAMRQLITCKICDRFMYEPYALSCGHTYCYSCLSQWLVSNHKKTCPDCRSDVNQQPNPAYIIRELVLIFVNRTELLADGETTDEHDKLVKEEAEIVAKDKANTHPTEGGLFRGCFSRKNPRLAGPLYDASDNVNRCPGCTWELEEGWCNNCGIHVYDSDLDEDYSGWERDTTDDELDEDLGIEDADAHLGAEGFDGYEDYLGDDDFDDGSTVNGEPEHRGRNAPGQRHGYLRDGPRHMENRSPIYIGSDEESEEDEDDPETRAFIVNDDHVDYATSEADEGGDATPVVQRRPVRIMSSDDEDEDETADPESEPESEDDEPMSRVRQVNHARLPARHRVANLWSDDEDDDSDHTENGHESDRGRTGGFSPLDGSATERSYQSDQSDDGSRSASSVHGVMEDEEDEDGPSESDRSDDESGWGTDARPTNNEPPPQAPTRRPVSQNQGSRRRLHAVAGPASTTESQFNNRGIQQRLPQHPFTLGNTLANINNYNQRNQQARARPSGAPAGNRNLAVGSSASSGSSRAVRPARRKRALSISSDESGVTFH